MLKISGSTEFTIRPKKSGVGIDDNRDDNGGYNNGGGHSDDSDKKCLLDSYQSFIQSFNKIASPLTSMIKTSLSMYSSIRMVQIAVDYDKIDSGDGKLVEKLLKS